METPGRNELCYCGSGKKYKQCHMREDQQKEREARQWIQAADFLRRDLPRFSREERFADDFAKALPLYWNNYYDMDNVNEMSDFEALRFLDWFTFDWELEGGGRIIEHYQADASEDLSTHQQALLTSWLEVGAASGYELIGYEGQTLSLKDFLTGEEVNAFEAAGRGNVEIGEVILIRIVPVHDHNEFSTVAGYLPVNEITDVKEKLEAAKTAFVADNPDATDVEFMRKHGVIYIYHALEQAEKAKRAPVSRVDPNRTDPPIKFDLKGGIKA